jgi:1-acyl-sn-glycerol-3-phosphate acyltransferase
LNLLCRVDSSAAEHVPEKGPLIVILNHISFLDVPVFYLRMIPRPIAAYARHDSWDNIVKKIILDHWGAFPIHRHEPDRKALRWGLEALEAGFILGIAPEGTRSGHGRLQEAHPGAVFLALRSGAPVLPVVYYGNEDFRHNIAKLKKTDVVLKAGRLFHLVPVEGEKVTKEVRKQMMDEMMCQIAALLPPEYRGVYADESQWTEKYIKPVE